MRNRFAGSCTVCGNHVEPNTGDLQGPPWKLRCGPCAGVPAVAVKPAIKVTLEGSKIVFEPTTRLGDDFGKYRKAIDGAKFEDLGGGRKVNTTVVDKANVMVARLNEGGFTVNIAPEAVEALKTVTLEVKQAILSAKERTEEVDARLRERGLSIYQFQKEGVEWIASRGKRSILLGDEMGLGKTIQGLAALPSIPEGTPILVIGPAVAKGVWKRETAKWRPDLKVVVLSGRDSFRFPVRGEMVVTNYDILAPSPAEALKLKKGEMIACGVKHCEAPKGVTFHKADAEPCAACKAMEVLKAITPEGMVIITDEAHALKNPKARRTIRFRALSKAARSKDGRVWLFTATPMLHRAQETWAVLQAADLATEAFGNWDCFVSCFNGCRTRFGYEWGTPTEEASTRLKRVMLRRERLDVLPQLPVKTYRDIPVDIDAKTTKVLDKIAEELKLSNPDLVLAANATDEEIEKARQAAKNYRTPSFQTLSHARELLATAKIPALLEIVEDFEEQEEPVVVFSAHRAAIDLLGKREGWAVITGDTLPAKRTRIEDDFQAGKLKGVAATISAGGVAITLTRAHQAFFIDRDWSPKINAQAEDRVCRIGQSRGVIISRLIAEHPIDQLVERLLNEKENIIDASIGAATVITPVIEQPVEIDFEKMAADARAEAEAADLAKAEAERIAAERAKLFGEEKERRARDEAERKERERKEEKERAAKERAKSRGWVVDEEHPERHEPASAQEKWAAQALIQLAASDPDHAYLENGVGFSKSDSYMGHWLSVELPRGLTPKQWQLAIRLCRIYHRQVGECPAVETVAS